jgi:DNA end-binding protein Ku
MEVGACGITRRLVGSGEFIGAGGVMARAIWTGSLAFGLVNVPVGLYPATEDKTIHFNQFQEGTSDRIRYKRVNERTGREVDLAHIVRGHEISKGEYVLVTDEELEAVEPGRSRTIEIIDFVDLDEIDPIYFQKTYYLAPQGEGAERAYGLLRQAMAATGKAGIATFVMRGKQYLAAVRAEEDVLVLETMFFADEVRDPRDEIENLPAQHAVSRRELTIAKQLIESMATAWQPENYRDSYRERVEDLIERKRRGEEIVSESAPPEEGRVVDLMDALRRSAEAAQARGTGKGSRTGGSEKGARASKSQRGAGARKSGKDSRPAKARVVPAAGRRARERAAGRRRNPKASRPPAVLPLPGRRLVGTLVRVKGGLKWVGSLL